MEVNSELINIKRQKHVLESVPPNTGLKKVKVKSIEFYGVEDVYNMEVENHHNFAVEGGFIIHNSIDMVRYALSMDMRGDTFSFK